MIERPSKLEDLLDFQHKDYQALYHSGEIA